MTRTVIRYPGRPARFVGPFGDETVAREWFAEHGSGGRVSFIPLELPDPPPQRLPQIPRRFRLSRQRGGFVRVDELADQQGDWFVLGPDSALPLDRDIQVWQRAGEEFATVHIDYYVAERTVRHVDDGYGGPGETTRYVLAAFTNIRAPEED